MINITINNFDNTINLRELASLSFSLLSQYKSLGTPETYNEQELEQLRANYKFILFRAYTDTTLKGFLLLKVDTPKFGIVWDWNPIVLANEEDNYIANELLVKCINFSRGHNINRLEVCFTIPNEELRTLYLKQMQWYKGLGFYKIAEELTMGFSFEKYIPQEIVLNNYNVKTIDQVNTDKLPKIAYKVFNNSQDKGFLDLGEEEKQVMCNKYFDFKQPIIKDASFILTQGKKIIGFSIVKTNGMDSELNSIGIIPKYRTKKLARSLLILSLNKLAEKGFSRIILDVLRDNYPAYNLYLSLGFSIINTNLIYALNL
jgi:ribosomal protein S18 acetylase RimI-like enzyme